MNRSIYVLASVFFVLIILKKFFYKDGVEHVIERLLESTTVDSSITDIVRERLGVFVATTRYENKWNINKPIEKDHINIYIFDSKSMNEITLKKLPRNIIGNCLYIGAPQLITCDASLFHSFVRNLEEVTIGDANAAYGSLIDDEIVTWVLGHEIGHLIRGHKAAHFKENSLDAIVAVASISQSQEYEADMYMATRLIAKPKLRDDMIHYLVYLIRLYGEKIQGIRMTGPGMPVAVNAPIVLDRNSSHPEFIIRSYRLLKLLKTEELYPELTRDFSNLQGLFQYE